VDEALVQGVDGLRHSIGHIQNDRGCISARKLCGKRRDIFGQLAVAAVGGDARVRHGGICFFQKLRLVKAAADADIVNIVEFKEGSYRGNDRGRIKVEDRVNVAGSVEDRIEALGVLAGEDLSRVDDQVLRGRKCAGLIDEIAFGDDDGSRNDRALRAVDIAREALAAAFVKRSHDRPPVSLKSRPGRQRERLRRHIYFITLQVKNQLIKSFCEKNRDTAALCRSGGRWFPGRKHVHISAT